MSRLLLPKLSPAHEPNQLLLVPVWCHTRAARTNKSSRANHVKLHKENAFLLGRDEGNVEMSS